MKKIIALVLSALLMLQAVPFVFAQKEAEATLTAAQACPGEELTLTLSLSGCPPMKAMYIAPQYDENVLTLKSGSWLISGEIVENWSWEYGDAVLACREYTDFNADVFQLVFQVKETAAVKQSTQVRCAFMVKGSQAGQEVTYALQPESNITVLCPHNRKIQIEKVEETCVATGNNRYYICDCGTVLKADGVTETTVEAETIPALGHNWTEFIEDAAHLRSKATKCTERDTYWCDCIRCDTINTGAYFEGKTTGEHSFTEKLQDTTHLVPGYTGDEPVVKYYYDCAYCDTVGSLTYEVACGHTEKTEVCRKAATCLDSGSQTYYVCTCGTVLKADGVTQTTVEAEMIPALGHDEISHAAHAPNCTDIGWEAYVTCSRCDYSTYRERPALGHAWTEKLEDVVHLRSKAANCTERNTYWYDCTQCDAISDKEYFESITTGEHSFTEQIKDTAHLVPGSGMPAQYYYDCEYCEQMGTETFQDILIGDLDNNETVNEDDAIYLLQHVLMPEIFLVEQNVDYDHNGGINEDDAIYLLQHVLMPEIFPL